MGLGWFAFLFLGLVAGWAAEKVMQRRHGLLRNLLVGILGAYFGAWLFSVLGVAPAETFWGALVTATIGAVTLLWLVDLLLGRRR